MLYFTDSIISIWTSNYEITICLLEQPGLHRPQKQRKGSGKGLPITHVSCCSDCDPGRDSFCHLAVKQSWKEKSFELQVMKVSLSQLM